jgi:hypothetical protein
MGAPTYVCMTDAAYTLSANTARTILGVKAHANSGLLLKRARMGFLGTSATATEVAVDIAYCDWSTKSPGTNSTTITPVQVTGRVITPGFTAGAGWTAGNEPTTLTIIETYLIHPQAGQMWVDLPLGEEYDADLAKGFVLRANAPAQVDCRAVMAVSRC